MKIDKYFHLYSRKDDVVFEEVERPELNQESTKIQSSDLISRKAVLNWLTNEWDGMVTSVFDGIKNFPSAQPYTEAEIQKMQDLEQAELEKAYELGKAEALSEIIRCEDCKFYEIAQLKKDGTDNKRYKPSICTNGKYGIIRKPDWFCGDAKRREDEIH